MTESEVKQPELPEAFVVENPLEVPPTPAEVAEEQGNSADEKAIDKDTGKELNPNALPQNVVDPYGLRYKLHPAIEFENVVPFANFDGETLSEDRYLAPTRAIGLAPETLTDSDQPETPEEALFIPVESGNESSNETGDDAAAKTTKSSKKDSVVRPKNDEF